MKFFIKVRNTLAKMLHLICCIAVLSAFNGGYNYLQAMTCTSPTLNCCDNSENCGIGAGGPLCFDGISADTCPTTIDTGIGLTVCSGQQVTLTACNVTLMSQPTSDVTYAWTAPGSTQTGASAVFTFTPSGTGTVTLNITHTVTPFICSLTESFPINVTTNVAPIVTVSPATLSVCTGGPVFLCAIAVVDEPLSYQWQMSTKPMYLSLILQGRTCTNVQSSSAKVTVSDCTCTASITPSSAVV